MKNLFSTHYSRFTKFLSAIKTQCHRAFTLAETLIVIGIIGVVAALTLPNLNHATGDKERVTRVKKIYSSLTDAFDRAQVIYGDYDTWFNDMNDPDGYDKAKRYGERVSQFLKISKHCGNQEGCFANAPVLNVYGEVTLENDFRYLKYFDMYTLPDGISVGFGYNVGQGYITVDIDGPNKGKNQDGVDRFSFMVEQNTLIPAYSPSKYDEDNDLWYGLTGNLDSYYEYTPWVIQNGNLDYLKCGDNLNWETQTSCK